MRCSMCHIDLYSGNLVSHLKGGNDHLNELLGHNYRKPELLWNTKPAMSALLLVDGLCPAGQLYQSCSDGEDGLLPGRGVACERTCESYLLNLTCSTHEPCVAGCTCPPGWVPCTKLFCLPREVYGSYNELFFKQKTNLPFLMQYLFNKTFNCNVHENASLLAKSHHHHSPSAKFGFQ